MKSTAYLEKPAFAAGEKAHGFSVKRVEYISEIQVMAYELEHILTGARLLHLHCSDPENLFAIAFRTPPSDSTGVPHILEHAVLAGSERYPLKDVFNELMKGSLQTFINAFTYPDKTIYPVASQTRADFFNLARVYSDLVFRPRLLRETFHQEGHHLEFTDPETTESDLVISGIVYNEMKGAYSSPDTLMFKAIQEGIFPSGPYACDAGGNPDVIPSLTYEELKGFHARYYSPSNARFFLYGNIPTEEHLVFLKDILSGFERTEIDSSIGRQERRAAPVRTSNAYPVGKEEETSGKTMVNMAWLMTENTDYETSLLLEIAAAALIGSAAAPLKKALIDSGLGEDISPVTGMERDLRQLVFAVGLRGTDPEKADAVEGLILQVLKETAEKGFDRKLIEGIIHQVEFHGREIVRANYPYGIVLMGRVFHSWLYEGDPLAGLNLPHLMAEIRRKWEADPRLFQEVLKTWFLDNPHRVTSVLAPSQTFQEEQARRLKEKMARLKATFTREEQEGIRQAALRLKQFQIEPDPPAAAACLPRLKINEISPRVDRIPTIESSALSVPTFQHDIFTNGIAYLDLAFDISDIPEEMQPYLPLLGKITLNVGAAGLGYEDMAKRIALFTGGLSYHLSAGTALSAEPGASAGQPVWQQMIFRAKALYRNVNEAAGIMADLLTAGDLSQAERLRDLIREKRNGLHAAVIPSGHIFAKRSAAAGLTLPAWRDEQWHGRTQLILVNQLAETFPAENDGLREKLEALQKMVFTRKRLTINLTADGAGLDLLASGAEFIMGRLPAGTKTGRTTAPALKRTSLACAIPSQVSYVAQAFAAPTLDDPLAPYLAVISRFLSSGYLYKHIRVQGGAYGGMSQYEQLSGIFSFLSYRDPHIVETLEVYQNAAAYIAGHFMDQDELSKSIIGTIGAIDKPMDPASRGFTALIRHFAGLTDERRERFRHQILGATSPVLKEAAAEYFAAALKSANIAVYGAEEELCRAQSQLTGDLVLTSLLP